MANNFLTNFRLSQPSSDYLQMVILLAQNWTYICEVQQNNDNNNNNNNNDNNINNDINNNNDSSDDNENDNDNNKKCYKLLKY